MIERLAAAVPDGVATVRPGAASDDVVESVMTGDLLLVAPDTTLDAVARTMRQHDAGCVLVVDEGRLVGILTARDVLRAVAGGVSTAEAHARRWMTASPITVGPRTRLDLAGETMAERGIHHLPVVEDGRLLGLVGLRDVTRSRRTAKRLAVGLGF